ncbi:MAG: hypothetical protein KKD44_29140 [Proteobacteria bacterium]|nr:hypothetical protein [Pseudomonadota bacterium]
MPKTLIIACLAVAGCLGQPRLEPGLTDGWYEVQRIVDGDTLILTNVGRVRLADVDAPEPGEPGGDEATAALAELLEHGRAYVRWVRRKSDGMPVRDAYGRLLGEISAVSEIADIRNP